MSSGFNVIRRHSLDATGVRIKELTQQLAKQRSQNAGSQLETDDIRSQGRMDHATIKLNDERLKFMTLLNSQGISSYAMPTEPDFNYLKVWFMLDHLGSRMYDMSGFGNDAYIAGHPTLRRASLSLGYQQTDAAPATPAMLFNSGFDIISSTNGEYIWIPDNPSIQFTQFGTGFSIACRFCCLDFNTHYPEFGGNYSRRIAAKSDNASSGWTLLVYPTGTNTGGIEFEIMHDNVQYARRASGYTAGYWYQVVVTYDPAANPRIKMYTAGTENSISSTFGTLIPTYTNLRIGARSGTTGFFRGYLHDFRMYMGKVLTQTEITNLNTNELTIDNIEKSGVFLIQYGLVGTGSVRKTRTHKYHVNGRVTQTQTHKYTVEGRLYATATKTHKFNLIQKLAAPQTQTHKYTVTGVQAAPMGTQYVRFTKSTTSGTNITQDVTFSSTPQAIIVWSDGTTSNNTFNNGYQTYYGFSDGTHHACVSSFAADNVTTTDTFSGHLDDRVISLMNTTIASMVAEATVSFSTNKATFTWTTNDTRAVYIHCLALWGLNGVEVKTFTNGTTATGNRTYSLNNGSLIPDFLHTITRSGPASWGTTYGSAISIGSAVSTSRRWSIGNTQEDARSTSADYYARGYYDETNVIVGIDDDTGTTEDTAVLYSLGTGQFTLNWTDGPTSSTAIFSALCIDSNDSIDVYSFSEPASTGTQNISTASNVDVVKGVMIYSNAQSSSGYTYDTLLSVGGGSGTGTTDQGCVSAGDDDVSTATRTARINKTGSIVRCIFPAATASSSTTDCEAALSALGTDQFTLNWTTSSGSRRMHYIAFGDG